MIRNVLITALALALVAPTAHSSETSDCPADLAATGQYVLILKDRRDRDEEELARLRYQLQHWQGQAAKLAAEKKMLEAELRREPRWQD